METGRWNNHVFTVSPRLIRGFTGLAIKGSSETEDMQSGSQYHIARKAGKPAEVGLTVSLSALTGCRVREEAMALVNDARAGAHNYFYVGGKKLMTCQLMLTEANVENVVISPRGVWVSADVHLTLRQCGANDGGFGGGTPVNQQSGGSGGSSGGKTGGTTQKNKLSQATKDKMKAKNLSKAEKAKPKQTVRSAVTTINRIVNTAKNASKKTGGGGAGGGSALRVTAMAY